MEHSDGGEGRRSAKGGEDQSSQGLPAHAECKFCSPNRMGSQGRVLRRVMIPSSITPAAMKRVGRGWARVEVGGQAEARWWRLSQGGELWSVQGFIPKVEPTGIAKGQEQRVSKRKNPRLS